MEYIFVAVSALPTRLPVTFPVMVPVNVGFAIGAFKVVLAVIAVAWAFEIVTVFPAKAVPDVVPKVITVLALFVVIALA